jgi:hypothetical protein
VEPLDKKKSFAVCFSGEKFALFGFFLTMGESCRAHTGCKNILPRLLKSNSRVCSLQVVRIVPFAGKALKVLEPYAGKLA